MLQEELPHRRSPRTTGVWQLGRQEGQPAEGGDAGQEGADERAGFRSQQLRLAIGACQRCRLGVVVLGDRRAKGAHQPGAQLPGGMHSHPSSLEFGLAAARGEGRSGCRRPPGGAQQRGHGAALVREIVAQSRKPIEMRVQGVGRHRRRARRGDEQRAAHLGCRPPMNTGLRREARGQLAVRHGRMPAVLHRRGSLDDIRAHGRPGHGIGRRHAQPPSSASALRVLRAAAAIA